MAKLKHFIRAALAVAVLAVTALAAPPARQPAVAAPVSPLAITRSYLPVVLRQVPTRYTGVFVPLIDNDTWAGEVDDFIARAGKGQAVYPISNGWDCPWASSIVDLQKQLNRIRDRGGMPLITTMPMNCSAGGFGDVDNISLPDILNGDWDDYLTAWAYDVKALGYPVFVRWGHEMNIPTYAWAGQNAFGADGKTHYTAAAGQPCGLYNCFGNPGVADGPERYIAAYRRVHNVVDPIATNIIWVWNPNSRDWPLADAAPWNQYNNYYPGADYVDWVALDGYNWGDNSGNGYGEWVWFDQIFGNELNDLRSRYPNKPQMIVEIGSVEDANDFHRKANFIRDAYARAFTYPNLKIMIWVHDNTFIDGLHFCPGGPPHQCPTLVDFRINSSPAAQDAFREAVGPWASDAPFK